MSIYKYTINMKYMNNGREYEFDGKNIHNVYVEYDYVDKYRPLLFATLAVDKNIIDIMIDNKGKDKIILEIKSFDCESQPYVFKTYIKQEFLYFLKNENKNDNKDLDYATHDEDSEDKFTTITIGMMNQKLIESNNVMINHIVKDATICNMLLYYLGKTNKVLMEPILNNYQLSNFLIPPMEKITNFIEFMNEQRPFYETKYRLFFDNDTTYLLSSSGKKIPSKNEQYHTIIINNKNTELIESKEDGLHIDDENSAYIINNEPSSISYYNSNSMFNTDELISIDGSGNVVSSSIGGITGTKINRTVNNAENTIDNNSKSVITSINMIVKHIDSSVITLNKEYYIRNEDLNFKNNDGKYILTHKKEIYMRENEHFILNTNLGLKKIT